MNLISYFMLKYGYKYGKMLNCLLNIIVFGTIIIALTFIKWPIYVNFILVIIALLLSRSPIVNLIPAVLMIMALFNVIKLSVQPLTIVYWIFFAIQVFIYISPLIKINRTIEIDTSDDEILFPNKPETDSQKNLTPLSDLRLIKEDDFQIKCPNCGNLIWYKSTVVCEHCNFHVQEYFQQTK